MGKATLRYRPLEGEPAYRPYRPIALSLPLAVLRLGGTVFLALLRLTVTSVAALVIIVALLYVGLRVGGGHVPAVGDANDYLSNVLHVSAAWLDDPPQLSEEANTFISETSSTSTVRPTPPPGSAAALVATLSQLTPPELQQVYQEAIPALQQYDVMLTDVQSALATSSDLDSFFAAIKPWLDQLEAESQSATP
jgi:hypothetical protein